HFATARRRYRMCRALPMKDHHPRPDREDPVKRLCCLPLALAAWALFSHTAPAQYPYAPTYYNAYNPYNYYNNYPRPVQRYPIAAMPYAQASGPYCHWQPAMLAPPVVYQYAPLDGSPLALPAAPAAPAKEAPLSGKAAARSVVIPTAKGEAPPAAA